MGHDLQQTRYDQLIRRVGGIIGPGPKVAEALSELFPTLDVENVPGELLFLSGWRLGIAGAGVAGDATKRARIQLFNPVGSGKLAVVSSVYTSTSALDEIRFSVGSTPLLTGLGIENVRDTRQGLPENTVCQLRSDSTVAKTDAQGQLLSLANTPFTLWDPNGLAILAPGTGFEIGTDNVNSTLVVTFMYRERQALESELLFP